MNKIDSFFKKLNSWSIKRFIYLSIFIFLGLFLTIASEGIIKVFLTFFISAIILVFSCSSIILFIRNKQPLYIIEGIVDISLALMLSFWIKRPFTVYIGLLFLVIPFVRFYLGRSNIMSWKKDFKKFFFGFAILILNPEQMNPGGFVFLGTIFFILAISIILSIFYLKPVRVKEENPVIESEHIIIDSKDHREL